MPRTRKAELEVEFVDDLPPAKTTTGGAWLPTLTPLLVHKGRWARVKEFDSPEQAHGAQSNLHRRKVRIPQPEHDWAFAARGCELFAIYRGPFHNGRPIPKRRTKRK